MPARITCNLCGSPLAPHCPSPHNHTCAWPRCTSPSCSADLYDVHRGILRHRDGHSETWAEAEITADPPTITIDDDTDDGRTTAPDA